MQHRSPILFWLLLAATLCVDAVVLSWQAAARLAPSSHLTVVFHALILGQLAVISVCCVMNPSPTPWTWAFPVIAAALAALATVLFTPLNEQFPSANMFASCFGYFAGYVAILMATLWLLKRSRFWTKRTGVARSFQYRVIHVLALMTVCGVLSTLLRNNPLFESKSGWLSAVFIVDFVALALASVVIYSLPIHWILRSALVTGIALLVACIAMSATYGLAPLWSASLGLNLLTLFGAYYLIQAVVLWIWLSLGQIVPELNARAFADSQVAK